VEILAFLSLNSYLFRQIVLKPQYDRPGDLITRDTHITEDFLFVKCHPLLHSVMRLVFDYEVDYGEMVNELYLYLMEDDAAKLRNFQYRSSVYQWLKVLSVRFFVKKSVIIRILKNIRDIQLTQSETGFQVYSDGLISVRIQTRKGSVIKEDRFTCFIYSKDYFPMCNSEEPVLFTRHASNDVNIGMTS